MTLQSHHDPHRMLRKHVAEVGAAARALLDLHSGGLRAALTTEVELAVKLHDAGKGSAAFQTYIRDPAIWRGDPASKAHTPLSLILCASHGKACGWTAQQLVRVGMAVRGHHGGLLASGDLLHSRIFDGNPAVLVEQLGTVDLVELATSLHLASIAPIAPGLPSLYEIGEDIEDAVKAWPLALSEAVPAWTRMRAIWSILLESDKVFLAVASPRDWLHRRRPQLPSGADVDRTCEGLPSTPLSGLRDQAREAAKIGFERATGAMLTLTLPTGAGKTLIAARWALDQRSAGEVPRTVILALPMLSIVDQTERTWRRLLGDPDGTGLIASHSVADRVYIDDLERGERDFLIDSWTTEVVVTTFDQLLLALFSDRSRHGLRFHHLLDALIVIDEVQAVPTDLWVPVAEGLRALTESSSTRVLAMTATPTGMLGGAEEVLADPGAMYASLARYRIEVDCETPRPLDAFAASARSAMRGATLVTVNTRAAAQSLWAALADLDPLLLSGDLTPSHRLRVIDRLRERGDVLVVSTQCVEAGVDIDMDTVIRDLAPLDSIVQVAGRCNRHAHRAEPDRVLLWSLERRGKLDSALVYDPIQLQETRRLLARQAVIEERDVLGLCEAYFRAVSARVAQGRGLWERAVRLQGGQPHLGQDIHKLLRGEDREDQEAILVIEQDPELEQALLAVERVADRWDRRAALRQLGGRVARITVQTARDTWRTRTCGPFRLLQPGQYDAVRGLVTT